VCKKSDKRNKNCSCGGTYKRTNDNLILASLPPQEKHKCNLCNKIVYITTEPYWQGQTIGSTLITL